ncbi:hypothetical protein [Paenibacillus taichungensis]|uniref:hypothetical protein n=1 Tax=Paenibacillus taichungensis TaxID=484184 RepID=UPI0035D94B01
MTCAKVWKVVSGAECYEVQSSAEMRFSERVTQYREHFINSPNNDVLEKLMDEILQGDEGHLSQIYELHALLAAKKSFK